MNCYTKLPFLKPHSHTHPPAMYYSPNHMFSPKTSSIANIFVKTTALFAVLHMRNFFDKGLSPCSRHFLRQAQFFFGEADFFSAKRLFLRAARDVSGVRSNPLWARVVIELKTRFQALSHSSSHARASALTSPPPDFLFSSIPLNTIPPSLQIQNSRK